MKIGRYLSPSLFFGQPAEAVRQRRGDCLGDRSPRNVRARGMKEGRSARGRGGQKAGLVPGSRSAVTRDNRNLVAISGVSVLWPSRETSWMHRLFLVVIEEL